MFLPFLTVCLISPARSVCWNAFSGSRLFVDIHVGDFGCLESHMTASMLPDQHRHVGSVITVVPTAVMTEGRIQ